MRTKVRSILVADNHDGIRDIITAALTEQGYFVVQAANGAEVFAVLACAVPDLLLLDLSMPHIDGRQVMNAVRVHHPKLPVVLITAALDAAAIAAELGARDHLVKPFAMTALLATVSERLAQPAYAYR